MAATMTEPRGQRARWSGAALVAPLAAVLFSGATAYSLHHDPHAAPAPVAAVTQVPKSDAALVSLRKTLLETAKAVAALRGQVATLKASAAGIKSTGRSSSATASSAGSAGSSAPIVINIPAPAPATHTTTGGS